MSSSLHPTIRFIRSSDLPVVHELIRELARYEQLLECVVSTVDDLDRALFGPQAFVEALVAEHVSEIVGFALFYPTYSTFLGRPGLYLEDLYVRPEFRGRGVGRALLVRLARLASERGWGRVEWSVLNWNEPSIAFYRTIGAIPLNDWTVYRLSDDRMALLAGTMPAPSTDQEPTAD